MKTITVKISDDQYEAIGVCIDEDEFYAYRALASSMKQIFKAICDGESEVVIE